MLGDAGTSNIQGEAQKKLDSVLRCPDGVTEPGDAHFLQPGREPGSFILTREAIRIPEATQEFAINTSNQRHWHPSVQAWRASPAPA